MAEDKKKIKSALISVFYKDGLGPVVKALNELGVTIYSTGGTQKFIEDQGIDVIPVEKLTGYPSILGGRVKTLHPAVFGGILARRELDDDLKQLKEYDIPEIDLVIVDLYPFEETVASGAAEQDIIEKIDIGGISLIRAAAKNFKDVYILPSRHYYGEFLQLISESGGTTTMADRKKAAARAFDISSHYDTEIFNFFDGGETAFKVSYSQAKTLRYGENPHQRGWFYGPLHELFDQLNGKELSYNNLLDVDAAVNLIAEFEECTFAVLKHNNACGLASRDVPVEAFKDALAGDPVSAFGGIIITNRKLDLATAEEIDKLFYEVLIAPEYDQDALEFLKKRKTRIILRQKETSFPDKLIRTALNGVLVQDRDKKTETRDDFYVATKNIPSGNEVDDLLFANKIVKHTKSNTIVLAKNKQLVASGTGQTSRIDALKQAIDKARSFGFELKGAVMASDAFFPFSDSVEIAHKAGISAVIQPGGSIRDEDSVNFCNENGMSMVMTGTRHFKH